jgi:putative hydrolase of the HAD superfamily
MAPAGGTIGVEQPAGIRLIVSDFGGVICTFDYRIFCERLARRTGRTTDEVFALVFDGDLQVAFEAGALSGSDYHRKVMGLLRTEMPYDEFFHIYGDIFTEIPPTCALLHRLAARYPLYLLSDTNEIHFGYVRQTVEVVRLFEQCVVSYEVGVLKPDPRIYQEVLQRSGLPAEACVFIDDRPGNVEGARRVGMQALLFQSAERCAADLEGLGVVIP